MYLSPCYPISTDSYPSVHQGYAPCTDQHRHCTDVVRRRGTTNSCHSVGRLVHLRAPALGTPTCRRRWTTTWTTGSAPVVHHGRRTPSGQYHKLYTFRAPGEPVPLRTQSYGDEVVQLDTCYRLRPRSSNCSIPLKRSWNNALSALNMANLTERRWPTPTHDGQHPTDHGRPGHTEQGQPRVPDTPVWEILGPYLVSPDLNLAQNQGVTDLVSNLRANQG